MNKGQEIYDLAKILFPICRSITGAGVRETLSVLVDYIDSKNENRGGCQI